MRALEKIMESFKYKYSNNNKVQISLKNKVQIDILHFDFY